MNRQQRRRTKEVTDNYTESFKSALIILGVVFVIVLLFYLITVAINNKNRKLNTTKSVEEEVEIQYDEILAGETFGMPEDDYYVLFYYKDGPNASYYDYLVNTTELKVYTVDLSSGFNTKYIGETANKKASKASDLSVKEATLINIKKGKNVKYVEGTKEDIKKILGN